MGFWSYPQFQKNEIPRKLPETDGRTDLIYRNLPATAGGPPKNHGNIKNNYESNYKW